MSDTPFVHPGDRPIKFVPPLPGETTPPPEPLPPNEPEAPQQPETDASEPHPGG